MTGARAEPASGRGRVGATAVFAVVTGLTVIAPILAVLGDEPLWPNALTNLFLYPFAVVGVIIAVRRPRNPVAWLCLAVGAAIALEGVLWGAALYGFARPGTVPHPEVLANVGDAVVMPALFLMTTLLLLLFPDGRLPSPRWRWLAWLSGILIVGSLVVGVFQPATSGWGRPAVDNPLGLEVAGQLDVVFLPLFGCVAASVVAMVQRFRRAAGVERLQLRWLVTSGAGATLAWVLAIFVAEPLAGEGAAVAVTSAGFVLVPVGIGVAVLRYRLFEIDRLISRTVSYGLVVGVLTAVYAGGVLLLRGLFPLQNELAVAASTLAVAALFQPLRGRVQLRVDRRFNRSRYDAGQELDRFAGRLRDELDLDDLTDDVLGVVTRALQPSSAGVWLPRTR